METPLTSVEQTPAAVVTETPQTPRDAVIAKYEQMYGTPAEPSAPATVAAEPVAPVVETPEATPQPDLASVLTLLTSKITEMDQRLAAAQNPAPQPTAAVGEQDSWLKLLAEGKQSEGEKALANVLGPQIQQQAVQQALALMQAEREVNDFTTKIKADNPDLMAFESYITLGAQQRIALGQAAGTIKSPADYVNVYKDAVKAEIENARKLSQSLRGAGATQAATRIAEVVASPVLQPSAVNTNREQAAPRQEAEKSPEQITQDYFAERKQRQAKMAGMTV